MSHANVFYLPVFQRNTQELRSEYQSGLVEVAARTHRFAIKQALETHRKRDQSMQRCYPCKIAATAEVFEFYAESLRKNGMRFSQSLYQMQ